MFKALAKLFTKNYAPPHDQRFPLEIKKHWYCGCWYLYLSDLRKAGEYDGTSLNPDEIRSPAEGKVAFNPWRTDLIQSNDESNLIDGLIPAIRFGNTVGLYQQVGYKYRETNFYDGAPWDDGYLVDLKFVRTVEINPEETND